MVAAIAAPAHAQPRHDDAKAAEAHYRQGEAFFSAKNYDKAIDEFQAAYDLVSKPALLFNLGLCYRAKGDHQQALENFKRYIEADPRGNQAKETAEYIAALTVLVDAERAE